MNEDFYRGSKSGTLLFFIGALIVIVSGAVTETLTFPIRLTNGLILLVMFLLMVFLQNKVKKLTYQIYQAVCFMLMAILFGIVFSSTTMFFCTMALQCVIMLMHIDSRFLRIQGNIMLCLLILMGIPCFMGFERAAKPLEYVTGAITLMGVHWLCSILAKSIELRDRRNHEQELCLDDLLKIVEDKCDEARAATKSKSDFLSNMSHEIRTPLNSVLGMNELILRESNDDTIIGYACNVENSGRLLLSLINDILDFSKIESGRMEIVPVRYHITSVVNDTVNMLTRRFEEKGLVLNVNADPSIPGCLFGDEVRIRQILTNIMTNAVKYTDKGSVTLTVGYKKQSDEQLILSLSVKDTGRGIKEEDKEKLFKGFTRVDQARNRHIEGTGLGLSITSQLVSMMSGTIDVNSVYGEGSEFIVQIPQKIINSQPAGEFGIVRRSSATAKYKESFTAPEASLLVTDDNKSNIQVVEGLLKPTKIQVDSASSGYECLNRLRAKKYNILLLDHMMPEMDGVETLQKIKEENLAPGMPIVALTANAISGARDKYVEYGFEDYLPKPISGKSLEKMVMALLPPELVHLSSEEAPPDSAPKETPPEEKAEQAPSGLISRSVAMTYCGDSEELYMIILQTYCEEFEERLNKLYDFYEKKDLENYRIVAHSLKSNSLNIGAEALSAQAKAHEFAARDEIFEVIAGDFDCLIENYKAVNAEAHRILEELEEKLQGTQSF
ncbi:MAG: response regulator [Oscillospiraceae bacterium]|nr:response regulator [Oscillospiraceae bacterium]